MAKLVCLGTGYELWANTTNDAVNKLDNILSVIEEIRTPESIKKYLHPTWDAKSLSLAMSNGHLRTSWTLLTLIRPRERL